MSAHSKVVWSEGLFLQPQHFQQQDRYFERYVEARCHALTPFSWGFTELEFERDLLRIGKLALRRAAGVFPDGTPFRMPEDDPLPAAREIARQVRDEDVLLAIPLRRVDAPEIDRDAGVETLTRHDVREWEARSTVAVGEPALLEVGALKTRLLLASEVTGAYATVPLAHIVEVSSDSQVTLDDRFMPTAMRVGAVSPLSAFLSELLGMLNQRGEALSGRVVATGRGTTAEIADFLMLQAINRYEPVVAHLVQSKSQHPETVYRLFLAAAGELATFMSASKRRPQLPPYRHERLRESFEPVIASLRASLSGESEQRTVPIPIETRRFGVRVATVNDRSLYGSSVFVLAARADMPAEDLRRRFPLQLKLGPVEKIRDLVNLQLPGVPVVPLPVAPRQIPYHAGFVYFELDQSHDLWAQLKTSGGIAMHLPDDFPGLGLELWAVRS
jgi:type VI secretion system protein ImpJ